MSEEFSENAKKLMQSVEAEARKLNHYFIGTMHVLLVLTRIKCSASLFLANFIDLAKLAQTIEQITRTMRTGSMVPAGNNLPQTSGLKRVIKYATEEAESLGHNYVGTGCLLLGLLKEKECLAVEILSKFGLTFEKNREKLLNFLKKQSREEQ